MTITARYAVGVAAVALAAALVGAVLGPAERAAVWWAAGLAVVVQGPLGWWLVRRHGSAGLLGVWGVGIVLRFALLALAAWVVGPGAKVPLGTHLFALAALLFLLLVVEAVVLSSPAKRMGETMNGTVRRTATLLVFLAAPALSAQEHAAPPAPPAPPAPASREIDIMHHLMNSTVLEVPYWKPPYTYAVHLPQFKKVHVAGVEVDFSITKHLVFLVAAATLVALVFLLVSRSVARAQAAGRPSRGFAGAMEAMTLFIRGEVVLPNVGPHGEGFAPYLLTVFFFILTCNLLGLLPWGATATGNISVTGALALVALVTIEIAGLRALGLKGYLGTIFYLPPGLPTLLKPVMLVIMTPIEIIGKLAKPFALAVRLFANMTAGHVVVLALIGLTFFFGSILVGVGASLMAMGIMLLELFVAFLQAFVFTLLTSVFIGLMRAAH